MFSTRPAVVILLVFAVVLLVTSNVIGQVDAQQITNYLEQVCNETGAPGISVAVAVNGEIVYSEGVGYAETASGGGRACLWSPVIPVLEVEIDIKPGSYPNSVNLGSNGVVPVAILSTADFDATLVDPETVTLAGADVAVRGKGSKYLAAAQYVDGDNLLDLVLHVETENFDPGAFQDGYACLTGETYDGVLVEGYDEITIVPPE